MKLINYLSLIPILLFSFHVNSDEMRAEQAPISESSTYSIEDVSDITAQDIDQLISFLPAIKFEAYQWTEEDFLKEGKLNSFRQELLRKWVRPFDWPAWNSQALAYRQHPDLLKQAPLEDIVKLITSHVRQDRHAEGHLLLVVKDGHMKQILNRLRDIRVKEPRLAAR